MVMAEDENGGTSTMFLYFTYQAEDVHNGATGMDPTPRSVRSAS